MFSYHHLFYLFLSNDLKIAKPDVKCPRQRFPYMFYIVSAFPFMVYIISVFPVCCILSAFYQYVVYTLFRFILSGVILYRIIKAAHSF